MMTRPLLCQLSPQIVDCFPIRVLTPRNYHVKKFLYQLMASLKVQPSF